MSDMTKEEILVRLKEYGVKADATKSKNQLESELDDITNGFREEAKALNLASECQGKTVAQAIAIIKPAREKLYQKATDFAAPLGLVFEYKPENTLKLIKFIEGIEKAYGSAGAAPAVKANGKTSKYAPHAIQPVAEQFLDTAAGLQIVSKKMNELIDAFNAVNLTN